MLLAFIYCLLFGALISPTDPVAVLGILTKAGLPKPLETNIVGESLFNDGVGVVLFATVLSVAATGIETTIPSQVLLLLLREGEGVGGLALGAVLGYGMYQILRNVDNYKVEVLLTLALVTGGSVLAAALHTSEPLAIVMAGLIVGSHQGRHGLSEATEDYLDKFWELIDGVLNAVMFALMGLEMLVFRIKSQYLGAGQAVAAVLLLSRLVSVSIPLSFLRAQRELALMREA